VEVVLLLRSAMAAVVVVVGAEHRGIKEDTSQQRG
jgi:hypothetical protein